MFPDARESRVAERSEIWGWVKLWIWRFGETTESTSNPISTRRDQLIIRYSSRARDFIADFASTIMRIIVVRSGIASNEWWNV